MATKRAAHRVFAALAVLGCIGAVVAGIVIGFYGDDRGVAVVSAVLFVTGVLGWAVSKPAR